MHFRMSYLGYSIMQPDILARKHIARERRISHPVSHGMIKEVALGPSPGQLHFQDCFHVLRVAPPANCGFSNSWFVKTGYARLFVRSTEICSRVRISGDVIPDDVIAILRF